jgi:solute carrier family 10 (sodium/bile acid cotransporter), member 7
MKIDGFLVAMVAAIGLAVAWPNLGAASGLLPMASITNIGIGLVFFLHGANLSADTLKSGASNWRLHIFIQCCTFVLFPIVGFAVFFATRGILPTDVRLGFFYLCIICSTISSSVAMVGLAKGNVSSAIFNATLSGLIGMATTPALLSLVTSTNAGSLSLTAAVADIAVKLMLPFILGQCMRPLLYATLARYKHCVTMLDRSVIVLIVFASFCDSVMGGLWSHYDLGLLLIIMFMVATLLIAMLVLTTYLSRYLGFSREDEITAVFCGSKKSLANGAPIATILFGANPALSMILLPLMLYHQLQLIVCASLAKRYRDIRQPLQR